MNVQLPVIMQQKQKEKKPFKQNNNNRDCEYLNKLLLNLWGSVIPSYRKILA